MLINNWILLLYIVDKFVHDDKMETSVMVDVNSEAVLLPYS